MSIKEWKKREKERNIGKSGRKITTYNLSLDEKILKELHGYIFL